MIPIEIIFVFAAAGAICMIDFKKGFLICIAAGFTLDIIRKLMPGEPVYLSGVIIVFVMLSYIGLASRGGSPNIKSIAQLARNLYNPFRLYVLLIFIYAGIAFLNTNSIVIPVIGLVAYLTPIIAILTGYAFFNSENRIRLFISFYVLFAIVMSAGIYLSFLGIQHPLLEGVGGGIIWYPITGGFRTLESGFYRAASVAGWHSATAACISTIAGVAEKNQFKKMVFGIIVLFFCGAIFLTARRKFIVEIFLFIFFFLAILSWGKYRKGRLCSFLLLIAFLGYILAIQIPYLNEGDGDALYPYIARSSSLLTSNEFESKGDTPLQRIVTMVGMLRWVIQRNGLIGSGAGTGSQGAQYFGGGAALVGYAAESGIGKILAELGVPGAIVILFLGYRMLMFIKSILPKIRDAEPAIAYIVCGFIAFLGANIMIFSIAHQVFGDVFVLLVLGWSISILFAIPRLMATKKPLGLPESQKRGLNRQKFNISRAAHL